MSTLVNSDARRNQVKSKLGEMGGKEGEEVYGSLAVNPSKGKGSAPVMEDGETWHEWRCRVEDYVWAGRWSYVGSGYKDLLAKDPVLSTDVRSRFHDVRYSSSLVYTSEHCEDSNVIERTSVEGLPDVKAYDGRDAAARAVVWKVCFWSGEEVTVGQQLTTFEKDKDMLFPVNLPMDKGRRVWIKNKYLASYRRDFCGGAEENAR